MMLTADRVNRLARIMRLTPEADGCWMHKSDNRWWLTGCVEGDQPLPQTNGVPAFQDALDSAEAWLSPELARFEELEHPPGCSWHRDWHACDCGTLNVRDQGEEG